MAKVEEMQKQREERRRKAAEKKNARAEEVAAAEGMGLGIESVDFLKQIRAYQEAHQLTEAPSPFNVADVWQARRLAAPLHISTSLHAHLLTISR